MECPKDENGVPGQLKTNEFRKMQVKDKDLPAVSAPKKMEIANVYLTVT